MWVGRGLKRWTQFGDDDFLYVEPPKLDAGEVSADLLARLGDCSHVARSGDVFALPSDLDEPEKVAEFLGNGTATVRMVELRGFEPLTLRLPA